MDRRKRQLKHVAIPATNRKQLGATTRWRATWVLALTLVVCAAIASLWFGRLGGNAGNISVLRAQRAMTLGDFEQALDTCKELLSHGDSSPSTLLIAGEAASRLKRFEESLGFYDRIGDDAGHEAAVARWAAGEVWLHLGHMSPTIAMMRRSLALNSHNASARERLIYLLNLSGQRWNAAEHLLELVKHDDASTQHLVYLGNLAKSIENEREIQAFLSTSPQDKLPLLGLARIRLRAANFDEARQLLAQVLDQSPDLVEAHVQLGKLILQIAPNGLFEWNAKLPSTAGEHPDIWYVRGEWARGQSKPDIAARCFCHVLLRDANHLAALHGLAQVLSEIGSRGSVPAIVARTQRLDKFLYALERILVNEWSVRNAAAQVHSLADANGEMGRQATPLEPIQIAAQLALELGRIWEALAWCRCGQQIDARDAKLQQIVLEAERKKNPGAGQTNTEFWPIDALFARSLNLPEWDPRALAVDSVQHTGEKKGELAVKEPVLLDHQSKRPFAPKFEEHLNVIDFKYFASREDFTDGRRMFEMTGGGVGVLDLDRDGRPDVFLAQGCQWPSDGRDRLHFDRLYRNSAIGHSGKFDFRDVTLSARIVESAFGQGVSVGDVDNDGFDDVYVCNVGRNQLWLNQGDGTFRDCNWMIPDNADSPGVWTVSSAIADLNHDGLPEIIDCNYVEGDDVYSRRCILGGLPRACSPMNFRPAPGRLLALDEQSIYRDVTSATLAPNIQQGNALGISILRTKNTQYPSLFVANDQVANLLLVAKPNPQSPLGIQFEDHALLAGLAFDGEGKAQACMGIAAGDVDRDGLIDLLVTNYYDEPNTLYRQQPTGGFRDISRAAGLVAPSLKMLGFGAQFLDAENDGQLDLVVLNGHIDDMSHMRIPFRMRSQFFCGHEQTRFVECTASEVGEYFARDRLGRALATGDFDGDGLLDFIATDLERPVSMVRNVSIAGNHLRLSLVGTRSQRDAIGAQVTVTIGEQSWTEQLTAGNGYMATNEKLIHLGVGNHKNVDRLEIIWPNSMRQVHENVPTNVHWLAVENKNQLSSLPYADKR